MTKLLIVVYRDSELSGGSVRVAETIAATLPALGFEVHALVAYGGAGRLGRILGDRCRYVRSSGPRDVYGWVRFIRMCREIKPDIVHFVDSVAWMIVLSVLIRARKVSHQHFRPDVGSDGVRRLPRIRRLSRFSDRVIAISYGAASVLGSKCKVPASKVRVVHNAVSHSYLDDAPLTAPPPRGQRVLGMAVRVVEDKGIEDAIRLLSLLPDRFTLQIAGDGPERVRFEKLSELLGVEDRVIWLGAVRDISSFYRGIDYYLYTSWYEGFGLSVAEAMWSGKPVVGFYGDGEIFEEKFPLLTTGNSLLVPRSRPGTFSSEALDSVFIELRDRLLHLDADSSMYLALASTGREWVRSRFSDSRFGRAVADIYCELVG
ncbi:glycosyltransferase family 4 protein [Thermomonas sp.]|uniref:glycosyltransferase family 4 protein n=1 Tax=Thermomonas sp. TaxID=1971895 RepID=UPI0035AEC3A8